jgi:phosphate acetyltransferase
MTRALYVMSMEPESGKSIVSLGVMEMLSGRLDRVGYFRPVIRRGDSPDATIELMRSRYGLSQSYDASYGVSSDQARKVGTSSDVETIISRILNRFDALAANCEMVLVEGTDHTGASAAFEFELNQRLATNLAAPVIVVSRAHDHRPDQISGALHTAHGTLMESDVAVVGYVVNRVVPGQQEILATTLRDLGAPVWFLPEEPRMLRPTVRQAAEYVRAEMILGSESSLDRDVGAINIAAMTAPHMLAGLEPDTLLVAAADRTDVILAGLAARFSDALPPVAGVMLTGGLVADPALLKFVGGFSGSSTPLLQTDLDTFHTATMLAELRPEIRASDDRKIAMALGLFETHVDTEDLASRIELAESSVLTPLMFQNRLLHQAQSDKKRIVLPEGSDARVLRAADQIMQREICDLTILGNVEEIREQARTLGLHLDAAEVIDPVATALRDEYAHQLYEMRRHRGMTKEVAHDLVTDVSVFGTILVNNGVVDGMVSGASHTTAETIRPALQIVKTMPGVSVVSSVFFMCLSDRVLVYGDCAVNPTPTPTELADIAISSAATAEAFGIPARVAMLSYSTGDSATGGDIDSVREATKIARTRAPDLLIEGPIQYDAAIDAGVAATKLPGSQVAGRATVFIFPDLNTGNNTYKAVQRSAGAIAIGPVLQGLRKPINDLSRGSTVADIIDTVAITAVQCQRQK